MATLTFEPLIPLALWLTLAGAAAALLAWYGWGKPPVVSQPRWGSILVLAALGFSAVLGILLNPTWVEPITPPAGKPLLTILVDSSASMATADADGGTRFQAAARITRALAGAMASRLEVRVRAFAGDLTPLDPDDLAFTPAGDITDLAAAIRGALSEDRPQGKSVVLLSDGIHNAGGGASAVLQAAQQARALACPVFTHTLGGDQVVRDLAVELPAPQELAYAGQKVPVPVRLRQRGLAGARTTVALLFDGKELERRDVLLAADETEVRFQVAQDKPGLYRYELRAEPIQGEVGLGNNAAPLVLRVVDRPVRLLLLEGKPYWDTKFLMRTLTSDASVEVDCVVRVSGDRLFRRTFNRAAGPGAAKEGLQEKWETITAADFLSTGDGLNSYQIVVLGRDAELFLTEPVQAQLRGWLAKEGGCLVCYRGQPAAQVSQPLAQLLPVRWARGQETRFQLDLTERGHDLHWFPALNSGAALAALPTLATAAPPEQPRPLAVVVATARGAAPAPAVTHQPYGLGRVVTIEGGGMWRWAFLPPEQKEHDDVYPGLWRNLLRWLVAHAALLPGQHMALRADKVSFTPAEPASATLLLREERARSQVPHVELLREGAEKPSTYTPAPLGDEPGAFRVLFGPLTLGRYEARIVEAETRSAAPDMVFDVRSYAAESLDLKARPDLMAQIAKQSGGAVLDGADSAGLEAQLRQHLERTRPQQVRRLPAWDRWWVLALVLALWCSVWALRRSGGLV